MIWNPPGGPGPDDDVSHRVVPDVVTLSNVTFKPHSVKLMLTFSPGCVLDITVIVMVSLSHDIPSVTLNVT